VEAGYKCNMTDIMAVIGQVELERYDRETLPKRKAICEVYSAELGKYDWAELPVLKKNDLEGCYHLYPLRIKNISESQRDAVIKEIFDCDVSVNVHFIPVPMMSFYKGQGYDIKNYPVTLDNYSREISLPIFFDLKDEQVQTVIDAVVKSVQKVIE
jgi:dTDP-4-amino-4,6-dideoxygalactose transaminase